MHNTRRIRTEPLTFIPELTRFEKENRKYSQVESNIMEDERADERTLLEFAMPGLEGTQQSITRPTINANNFEIKPALL